MIPNLRKYALLLVLPVTLTGCSEHLIPDLLGVNTQEKNVPITISDYHTRGKKIHCSEIGNAISKAYTLKKQGKSKEDIYWAITPEDSSYAEQDVYTILIDVGMQADAKSYKSFTEACRNNPVTYQEIFDTQSKDLYTRLDMLYSMAYGKEFKNYRASLSTSMRVSRYRYGGSRMDVKNAFINDESKGGLDGISNEINNLVYERAMEIIYDPKLMDESSHPRKLMPSQEQLRRQMAPELVLKLEK